MLGAVNKSKKRAILLCVLKILPFFNILDFTKINSFVSLKELSSSFAKKIEVKYN